MRVTLCQKCGAEVRESIFKISCPKCHTMDYRSDEELNYVVNLFLDEIESMEEYDVICAGLKHQPVAVPLDEVRKAIKKITGRGVGPFMDFVILKEIQRRTGIIRDKVVDAPNQTSPDDYTDVPDGEHTLSSLELDRTAPGRSRVSIPSDILGLVYCSACNRQISTKAESCPNCGHPTGVHICPRCNSANTKTISGVGKATSIFLWGPFAANKVLSKFQCKDCGHKF